MDDGSRSRNAVYLNTQRYDETSQRRLLRLLREQWGIEAALNRDKRYYRIRLSVVSARRLHNSSSHICFRSSGTSFRK